MSRKTLVGPLKFIVNHPLNRKHKFASVVRFFNWQFKSRIRGGSFVQEWIDGAKFLAKSGETGVTQNIYTGLHEFSDMAFLLHFLRSDDVFVDVGANVGSYTILACAARGARGYAFEPVPATFKRLSENLQLNKLDGRVKSANVAVGGEEGVIHFSSQLGTTNHALAAGESQPDSVDVQVVKLDTALAGESPTLMKIDVEGYETEVVRGAERTLRKESLQAVIMELNGACTRYGWDEERIIQKMFAAGFSTYIYDPFERKLSRTEGKTHAYGNTLFLRDESVVSQRLRTSPAVTVFGTQF